MSDTIFDRHRSKIQDVGLRIAEDFKNGNRTHAMNILEQCAVTHGIRTALALVVVLEINLSADPSLLTLLLDRAEGDARPEYPTDRPTSK